MNKQEFLALRKTVTADAKLCKAWQEYLKETNDDKLAMLKTKIMYMDDSPYYTNMLRQAIQEFELPEHNVVSIEIDALIRKYGWASFKEGLIRAVDIEHRRLCIHDFNLMDKLKSSVPAKIQYGKEKLS